MKRIVPLALLILAAAALLLAFVNHLPQRVWAALASRAAAHDLTAAESAVNSVPLPTATDDLRIVVTKSERRLRLYSGEKLVRVRRIGLGFAPVSDKEREGDGRTPEGDFYVCTRNERSRFYRALGLSYPNRLAAERGLRDRVITPAEHDEIKSALDKGLRPRWNTKLGGEIMIHGHGSKSDWTLGCVALEDDSMRELFDHVPLGTKVRIEP